MRDYIYLGGRLVAGLSPEAPTVSFEGTGVTVRETAGAVQLTVRLTTPNNQPLTAPITIAYTTGGGSATAGSDYTAANGSVSFPAGSTTGATRTFTVLVIDDEVYPEEDETIGVWLESLDGARVAGGSYTITIEDDDPYLVYTMEQPPHGQTIVNGFLTGGWVFDKHAVSGTGISAVRIRARPGPTFTQPGLLVGDATLGDRADVASVYGAQFLHSAFTRLNVRLDPGLYQIAAEVYLTSKAVWRALDPHTVTVVPSESMTIDLPANGSTVSQAFTIAGWAIDVAAPTGTGVDLVQATANPIGGGSPIALGTAAYGGNRPDVGTAYGDARFAPSGFSLSSASLLGGPTGSTSTRGAR